MPRHLTEASATPNNTSHGGVGHRASDRRPHLLQMDSNSGSFSDDDLTFYSGVSMLSSQRQRVPKLRPSVSNTSGRSTSSKGSLRGKEKQLKNERNQQDQGIAEESSALMSTKSGVAQQNSFKSHDSSSCRGRGRGTWLASLQKQKAEITKKVSEAQLSMQASMKSSDSIKSQRQNQSRTNRPTSHKPSHTISTQKVESGQAENQKNNSFMPILKLGTRRSRSWSPVRSIPSSDPASSSRSNDPISSTNSKKQIIRAPPASRSTVLKTNLSGVSSFGNWDTVSVASSFFKAKRKPKLQEPEPDLVLSADSSISTRQDDPNFSLSQSSSSDGDETDGESTSTSGETVSPIGAKIRTPRNFFSGLFNNFIKSPEEPSELEEGIASSSEEELEEQEMALSMSSDNRHGEEAVVEEEGVEEEAATETEVERNPDDANGNNDRNNDIPKEPQIGVPKAQRMSLFSTTKKRLGQTSKEEPSDRTISTVQLDSAKENETKGGIEVEVDPVISCQPHPPTLPKTPTTPKTPTRLSQIFGRKTPTSNPTNEEDSSSRASINTPRLAQIFTRKSPRGAEDDVGTSQPTPTRQKQCFGRIRNIKENADGVHPTKVPTKETIAQHVDRSRASSQLQNRVNIKREADCETGTRRSASAPSVKSENKSRASVQSTRSLRRQLARKSRTQTITMDTAKELLSGKATIRIFDPSPKNASGNSDVWYRGRSYVQSKERESQEPRQHLVSVSKTSLRKWLFFAKECIHEARTSIDNLECNSSISSTDTAETGEVNSVLSQVVGDEESANDRKDSSTKKGALDEVIEHCEEVAEETVTFQETKTDLGADSEEVDDLRSVSSFEVLFNCLTCSILPYDPNHHLNNDDDYFGGQISFTKINDHWKRVNSLRT